MNINILELNNKYANDYLIYTRKSTDDADNQKNSIAYQILESKLYAQRGNLTIASISIKGFCTDGIIEEHHSGFKQDDDFETKEDGTITYKVLRPKFLTLINLLRKKELKGVICLCWDRFSRNESDDVLIKKLMNQGIDVKFIQANYDNSSSGALHMDIDGMFSRHYSRVISEKVKASYKKLLAEGKCIYTAPIGYLNNGSDNKPFDPERAPIVKRIFELYASGEWSFASLTRWANNEGLTTRPQRKKRTKIEKAIGVTTESIPSISRKISPKTIENILSNHFYIGKIVNHGDLIDSNAHQPLIDSSLFFTVQRMLKSKTTSIHYPDNIFFTYRGLLKCGYCNRIYTPYQQKGITYYRPKCKENCENSLKNINESWITKQLQQLMDKIHLTNQELEEMELQANSTLEKVTEKRNKELTDLYRQLNRAMADFDFLAKDKLNLLRTGVYTPEQAIDEEFRLKVVIEEINAKIGANTESTQVMLEYVITFSKLVKKLTKYFTYALDTEQREIVTQVFSELYIYDKTLKYTAKDGYKELLKRFDTSNQYSGSPDYLIHELLEIYIPIKNNILSLEKLLKFNSNKFTYPVEKHH